MSNGDNLVLCYNRGCGQKYDPNQNTEKSCRHHPGAPFFHDAYKGWSCCNKKCTDFTEFLNIKGCTVSFHSNIKPPEPEKQELNEKLLEDAEKKESAAPLAPALKRPPFDTPFTKLNPIIAASLKQDLEKQQNITVPVEKASEIGVVTIGTTCKNNGCTGTYDGPGSDLETCIYHPGFPIFHEGLKYWSCCQKKTSDFNSFLSQVGCESGKHVWIKEQSQTKVNCRWDWHQTGSHVIVTIYAKQYCPNLSSIMLNPIRLVVKLVFPQQSNAEFNMDLELRGIVDIENSKAQMFGTKIEITLKKAEPGSWAKLNFPREIIEPNVEPPKEETRQPKVEELAPEMDAVDLSDL